MLPLCQPHPCVTWSSAADGENRYFFLHKSHVAPGQSNWPRQLALWQHRLSVEQNLSTRNRGPAVFRPFRTESVDRKRFLWESRLVEHLGLRRAATSLSPTGGAGCTSNTNANALKHSPTPGAIERLQRHAHTLSGDSAKSGYPGPTPRGAPPKRPNVAALRARVDLRPMWTGSRRVGTPP